MRLNIGKYYRTLNIGMHRETNMEMQGHTGLITDTETKTEWMTALFLHKRAIRKQDTAG